MLEFPHDSKFSHLEASRNKVYTLSPLIMFHAFVLRSCCSSPHTPACTRVPLNSRLSERVSDEVTEYRIPRRGDCLLPVRFHDFFGSCWVSRVRLPGSEDLSNSVNTNRNFECRLKHDKTTVVRTRVLFLCTCQRVGSDSSDLSITFLEVFSSFEPLYLPGT
jgi:hypothetical protein